MVFKRPIESSCSLELVSPRPPLSMQQLVSLILLPRFPRGTNIRRKVRVKKEKSSQTSCWWRHRYFYQGLITSPISCSQISWISWNQIISLAWQHGRTIKDSEAGFWMSLKCRVGNDNRRRGRSGNTLCVLDRRAGHSFQSPSISPFRGDRWQADMATQILAYLFLEIPRPPHSHVWEAFCCSSLEPLCSSSTASVLTVYKKTRGAAQIIWVRCYN